MFKFTRERDAIHYLNLYGNGTLKKFEKHMKAVFGPQIAKQFINIIYEDVKDCFQLDYTRNVSRKKLITNVVDKLIKYSKSPSHYIKNIKNMFTLWGLLELCYCGENRLINMFRVLPRYQQIAARFVFDEEFSAGFTDIEAENFYEKANIDPKNVKIDVYGIDDIDPFAIAFVHYP